MTRDDYISQHWVHAFHLRHFYDEEDRLWVFDKPEERTFPSTTSNVANADWFYDGKSEDPETEEWLQKVESAVTGPTGTYKKFVTLKDLSNSQITQKDIYRMALYMTVQELRTPAWRRTFRDTPEQLLEKIGENMAADFRGEIESLLDEDRIRDLHVDSMKPMALETAKFFATRMHWRLFENKTEKPLWTSDNPVIRHNEFDDPLYGNLGNRSPGLQVYFPLSPDVLLRLFDPTTYSDVLGLRGNIIQDPDILRFYRDLQVQYSTRQVFSSEDEFDQAFERIEETPEVASGSQQRMEINGGLEDEDLE